MPTISIIILRKGENPPWADVLGRYQLADPNLPWYAVALEGGMSSGAPSVALRLELLEGEAVIAETSLAAWIAATCAFRGAFPEAFAGGPLAVRDEAD